MCYQEFMHNNKSTEQIAPLVVSFNWKTEFIIFSRIQRKNMLLFCHVYILFANKNVENERIQMHEIWFSISSSDAQFGR